jgi:hypothetical protein
MISLFRNRQYSGIAMLSIKTCLTELATAIGIGAVGSGTSFPRTKPTFLSNVPDQVWASLGPSLSNQDYYELALRAWQNGFIFRNSPDGLRGHPPLTIEWKGPHKPPGYEYIPADLRVDHVYLISCKYHSHILLNTSPAHVFDRTLSIRYSESHSDWYDAVAADKYREFYNSVVRELGLRHFPTEVSALSLEQRTELKNALRGPWRGVLDYGFRELSSAIAVASAARWQKQLKSKQVQEQTLWRLLRLADAPYFVLGTDRQGHPIQIRVATPWDWRQAFRFQRLEVDAVEGGQPLVSWIASVEDLHLGQIVLVQGHVEIRWSHGKFNGYPEAKIYLDTPHEQVPGYFPLLTK